MLKIDVFGPEIKAAFHFILGAYAMIKNYDPATAGEQIAVLWFWLEKELSPENLAGLKKREAEMRPMWKNAGIESTGGRTAIDIVQEYINGPEASQARDNFQRILQSLNWSTD